MSPEALPLRDVHLPPPVGWWPLAPGWWIVLGLCGLALAVAVWALLWRQRTRLRRLGLLRLREIATTSQESSSQAHFAAGLSVLCRQLALACDGENAAALTGPAWCTHLDALVPGSTFFTAGLGGQIFEAAYRPLPTLPRAEILQGLEYWITHLPPQPLRGGRARV